MEKPTRKQAVTLHVLLSMLAVGSVASMVLVYWYPWDLLSLQGASNILLLIIFIDVILGPSLTLLVYKPGKRFLALDLTIIAAIQIAALSYGTYTLYQGKVSYLAFLQDQFYALKQIDLVGQIPFDLANTQRIGSYGPHIVEVEPLTASSLDIATIIGSFINHQSVAYIAARYRKFPTDEQVLSNTTLELSTLPSNAKVRIQKITEKLKTEPKALFYYPVQGKAMNGFVIFNPRNGKLVDIIAHESLEQPTESGQ
jgi:hypothetical protein